jgi:predicted transcriptional regulator
MKEPLQNLAKRERQVLEMVYHLGKASAADVRERLADSPSYSTVRKVLSILEDKGHVKHVEQDRRYVYLPTRTRRDARLSALKHLMDSLFDSSAESVVSTLLDISDANMSDADLRRLTRLIDSHRRERE